MSNLKFKVGDTVVFRKDINFDVTKEWTGLVKSVHRNKYYIDFFSTTRGIATRTYEYYWAHDYLELATPVKSIEEYI